MTDAGSTFDEVAELYHEVRPRYPNALFDALVASSHLGPGARVLEIGAGTGIATEPLAERGARITALEPGANLAAVARRVLAERDGVTVEVAPFESWPLPEAPFDLVVSATAFHWIDPEVRYRKTALALRPGGRLAIITYRHVAGGDDSFFERAQACYERFMPGTPPGLRLSDPEDTTDTDEAAASGQHEPPTARTWLTEVDASGLFDSPTVETWLTVETYDRTRYLQLLSTYSGHRLLDEDNRRGLFGCIGALIDGDFGGQVRKCYRHELIVARRR